MKQLTIKNFGPLKDVTIDIGKVNLIIGLQSSGKSCVMMLACFCSWVEKRIILRQSAKDFEEGSNFLKLLMDYYHCKGYAKEDTYIAYNSSYMEFCYDNSNKTFQHQWKNNQWRYKRPKISYIPAERNVMSLVTNWEKFETNYESIFDFKSDWDISRRSIKKEVNILGTGISYEFDETKGSDAVITIDNQRLDLINGSSGLQSLIPLFVHLDYLLNGIYDDKANRDKTYSDKQFEENLLNILYKRYNKGFKNTQTKIIHIGGKDFVFKDEVLAKQFEKRANYLLQTDHVEVFLEEPESNLFPITQFQLINWIISNLKENKHDNSFFIATHSPYILNALLQEKIKDFRLFITYQTKEGLYNVKTANEEDLMEIYSNGSDAYFNLEVFTQQ